MSWPLVKLGDCCEIVSGGTPKREIKEYWNGNLFWATPKDLSKLSGIYIDSTLEKITELGLKKSSATSLPKNSLLFSSRAPIGHLAITSTEMATNQGFKSLIPKNHTDVKYLFFCLRYFRAELENLGNGATFKEVSKKIVENYKIPHPPLPIQIQIAAALEKADSLRQQCQQMEQELNTLAQSVFLEMFGDPVTNPKGWEMIPLGDWAETRAGFAFKSEEYSKNPNDVKLCRGINIMPGGFNWKDVVYWKLDKTVGLDKYWMKKGDIVVAMDRPWISSGFKIAQVSEADLPSLLLQRVMRIRGSDLVENNYFYHCLNHQAFLKHSKITETTVPHISPNDINSYRVFKLDRKLLLEFDSRVSVINTMSSHNKKLMIQIETNFNSLMQRAFKGELDLKSSA